MTELVIDNHEGALRTLCFVIPCYNEEEALEHTACAVKDKLHELIKRGMISKDSRIALIDDGSKDLTWDVIKRLCHQDQAFEGVKLTRNCGHQNALLAGMMTVKNHFDFIISMDADLQDDIEAVDAMIDAYQRGDHVVFGVRKARDTDTFFKRSTATCFYKFMKVLGVNIVYNHADYRLMSRKALDLLSEYDEHHVFLRGLIPQLGLASSQIYYNRQTRVAGKTKYPFKKMLEFAIGGITSFSIKPLRLIATMGLVVFIVSILMTFYFLGIHLLGSTVPGWTTIVISIWAIGGLQILSLGIVGEYIGRMYIETKKRPKYFVETYLKNIF